MQIHSLHITRSCEPSIPPYTEHDQKISPTSETSRRGQRIHLVNAMDSFQKNFREGSFAVVRAEYSRMTGLGRIADMRPGGITALLNAGRSESLRRADLNGR